MIDGRLLATFGLRHIAEHENSPASPAFGFAPPANATASAKVSRERGKSISSALFGAPSTEKLCGPVDQGDPIARRHLNILLRHVEQVAQPDFESLAVALHPGHRVLGLATIAAGQAIASTAICGW